MKSKIAVPFMCMAALMLAACNTVEGVGRDVEAAGESIQDTSQEVEEDLTE